MCEGDQILIRQYAAWKGKYIRVLPSGLGKLLVDRSALLSELRIAVSAKLAAEGFQRGAKQIICSPTPTNDVLTDHLSFSSRLGFAKPRLLLSIHQSPGTVRPLGGTTLYLRFPDFSRDLSEARETGDRAKVK